jgi:ectoine hydroxylase-related dioxygenase (phytanoyl-CoA dioxygenase family)
MQLHADQGYVPAPWPDHALAVNVAWILDDYTDANGATRFVPGSHHRGHGPDAGEVYESQAIAASAGSILVMDGRLWHQTGSNRTPDCERAALFGYYVTRWLRPQINWNAALWPEVVATLSPQFLDRLGYYTGNVETQIPAGSRANVITPPEIGAAGTAAFPLRQDERR